MPISALCAATMMYSDNAAINLLMKNLGGPTAVTAFARSIGDNTFNANNWEVELNSNRNNNEDTTTPNAMGNSLQTLLLGEGLPHPQQKQLVTWMKENKVGDARIRTGVPKGWLVADKTGASKDFGISNDIGLIWPPSQPPIVIAIYTIRNKKDVKRRDDIVASAAQLLVESLSETQS